MGKDRFAPNTQRFADVDCRPALYVAELLTDDGSLVKVGVGGNARGRMMSLQAEVRRVHAADLGRFALLTKPTAKAAFEAETRLVARLSTVAERLPGRREFFTGLDYVQAVEVLAEFALLQRGDDGHPLISESLFFHGAQFCSGEPLNATQRN